MSVQVYVCRLFGGRDIGVTYDDVGGTISILGKSISIAALPAALQATWQAAVASSGTTPNGARAAFGGSNIGTAAGEILSNQPTWRNAVTAALSTFVNEQTMNG